MELIVHGTKGGFRTLYSTVNAPISIASDIRNNLSDEAPIGKSFYTISFTDDGYVFSKYKIIRDSPRSYAMGSIAFSIFLPENKKLSGFDVKDTLDNLLKYYEDNYIKENNINLGETREIIKEDWSFVDRIVSEIREQPIPSENKPQSGVKDPSFIYYKDNYDLCKYFDAPYQEEYCGYQKVLLIDDNLRGTAENPLNIIRHSEYSLTGKIDLENPQYKLLFDSNIHNSTRIELKINGNTRYEKNKVRRKDHLEIRWSRPYHEVVSRQGRWSELRDTYLRVDDQSQIVYVNDLELEPIKKSIELKPIDYKGDIIHNVEVKINNGPWEQLNTIILTGAQIGEHYEIKARQGERYFSKYTSINPELDVSVKIQMQELKLVNFQVQGGEDSIYNFEVFLSEGKIDKENNTIEFKDGEIDKKQTITLRGKDKNNLLEGREYFTPRSISMINITLKQKEIVPAKCYGISAGKYGKKSKTCPKYSNDSKGNDINKKDIKPIAGYKFKNFRLDAENKENGYDGLLVAEYEKKYELLFNPFVITGFAVLIIGLIFAYIYFKYKSPHVKDNNNTDNYTKMKVYLDGIELNIDTLKNFEADLGKQNIEPTNGGGIIFELLLGGNKNLPTQNLNIDENLKNIANAISIRNSINELDFSKLKKLNYSDKQSNFKTSINKIDSANYTYIKDRIGDIKNLNLNIIAEKIDLLYKNKPQTIVSSPTPKSEVEESNGTPSVVNKSNPPVTKENETQNASTTLSATNNSSNTTEIIQYLRGDELSIETLIKYSKESNNNSTLKTSIKLCLEFWDLDGSGVGKKSKTYYTFLQKIMNDDNLKNSDLKDFLVNMNKKSNPKYLNEIPGRKRIKTLKKLREEI